MEEALPQEPPQKRSRTAAQQQQCAKDGEASLLEAYNKMKQQQLDWRRRESALVLRLTTKEQEIHELQTLVHDLRGKQCGPTTKGSCNTQQTCGYVDPVLNANYTSMREQLKEYEKEIKSQKEQLAAVPVTNERLCKMRMKSLASKSLKVMWPSLSRRLHCAKKLRRSTKSPFPSTMH
eukprot:TRINITY_DN4698_c0_g1_i3.p1 TRINITY_DN4698_c0_g1~~TRINITY_DN4698_c0_g1_i3.p1  ORF type:complete len:187 (+),score=50.21 TRINITY_DN4698_c0_g1_i3:30-563(+)